MKAINAAIKTRTELAAKVAVGKEVNRLAAATMVLGGSMVAAWVLSAFISGVMASGGIAAFASGWLQAVIG